jgi:hypothetical protein
MALQNNPIFVGLPNVRGRMACSAQNWIARIFIGLPACSEKPWVY